MSWSIVVHDLPEFEGFEFETEEYFASHNASYPRDAQVALEMARKAGLKSATLSGGRTPNPYGGDEIVDISVRGTPRYKNFLSEMREIIAGGPGPESVLARHYAALARLRERPCLHEIDDAGSDGIRRCQRCGLCMKGMMAYFEDDGYGTE